MRTAARVVGKSTDRGALFRLVGAVIGLALAFFAAVYSTVARQSGNLLLTAIFATTSLLLAGIVGLTTIPYLARRVLSHRVRDAFDYDVTREGLVYLGLVLVIGVAALNTGNNLLFIVVSALLAAIVVSGMASASVLRGLELEITLPAHVFAGESVSGHLTLRNPRRLLPSFSVSVVPLRQPKQRRKLVAERPRLASPFQGRTRKPWFRLPDLSLHFRRELRAAEPIFAGEAYFPYIPARSTATAELDLHFARRGRYQQDGLGLATRFPFSFLLKTRRIALARELIVYPSVDPTESSLDMLPVVTGEFESFMRGRGHDLYRIREYQPEDPRRHVDWKATARTGSLKVREFTREDERKLRFVFDNPGPAELVEAEYEKAVRLAATLAWRYAEELADLSFVASGFASTDVFEFLHYLALVSPGDEDSLLAHLTVSDDFNLILTARPRGSIPTRLWNCSYVVFLNHSIR